MANLGGGRSPDEEGLVLAIGILMRRPGTRRPVAVDLPFAESDPAKVSWSVAKHLRGELVVESRNSGLTVSGDLLLDWEGTCRRCLQPMSDPLPVKIHELYELSPDEGETYALDKDDVDLAPMLREATLLELPLAPLCSDDCRGPAPDELPVVVATDPDPAAEPAGDPRWGALDALVFDDDESDEES